MSDQLLTVAEGERVLHDGKFYSPGSTFKLADEAAQTLLDEGVCVKGKGKVSEPDNAGAAQEPTGDEQTADDIIKSVPDADDGQLASLLEAEEQRDTPRKSVLKKIKAEQKKRADAASS